MAETKEVKELKANVKFRKSPNVYGYGNFIGEEAYVNPEHIITVPEEDKQGNIIENKFVNISALEFFLEKGIAVKL